MFIPDRIARPVTRYLGRARCWISSRTSSTGDHIFFVGDGAGWVLDEEAKSISSLLKVRGHRTHATSQGPSLGIRNQNIVYLSQFVLNSPEVFLRPGNRHGVAYLHGGPDSDEEQLRICYAGLIGNADRLTAIQVSNPRMRDQLVSSGLDPNTIHVIPLGVDTTLFRPGSPETRRLRRAELGIPADAFVIGSFQKDGVGWDGGYTPKLIKGPDILVKVLDRVGREIPNLHVLLCGPARGYVKRGLASSGIATTNVCVASLEEVAQLYTVADMVLITSREEGGPKALLEGMASGLPVASTAVGQAPDIIENGRNGWLDEVNDIASLADRCIRVARLSPEEMDAWSLRCRETALGLDYRNQGHEWNEFTKRLVGK